MALRFEWPDGAMRLGIPLPARILHCHVRLPWAGEQGFCYHDL